MVVMLTGIFRNEAEESLINIKTHATVMVSFLATCCLFVLSQIKVHFEISMNLYYKMN